MQLVLCNTINEYSRLLLLLYGLYIGCRSCLVTRTAQCPWTGVSVTGQRPYGPPKPLSDFTLLLLHQLRGPKYRSACQMSGAPRARLSSGAPWIHGVFPPASPSFTIQSCVTLQDIKQGVAEQWTQLRRNLLVPVFLAVCYGDVARLRSALSSAQRGLAVLSSTINAHVKADTLLADALSEPLAAWRLPGGLPESTAGDTILSRSQPGRGRAGAAAAGAWRRPQ